jgi:hypothetical protein
MSTTNPLGTKVAEFWLDNVDRFAPASAVANDALVIATVMPNPKRPGSKSYVRYDMYHRAGQTIGEFVAAYKTAKLGEKLARADLRWDLQHGFITLKDD